MHDNLSTYRWRPGIAARIRLCSTPEQESESICRPYRALASLPGQPYSFSRQQLLGKQADLGASRFSALYLQQPLSIEDQLFPEKVWRIDRDAET